MEKVKKAYKHLAINPETFTKFKKMKIYLLNPEKTQVTDTELLNDLIKVYESIKK